MYTYRVNPRLNPSPLLCRNCNSAPTYGLKVLCAPK